MAVLGADRVTPDLMGAGEIGADRGEDDLMGVGSSGGESEGSEEDCERNGGDPVPERLEFDCHW